MIVSEQLNYIKTRRFHAIFMPVIIEFSRCIGIYSSAKFELIKHFDSARTKNPHIFGTAAIHPHVLRHSKAMHLLESGVNLIYIRDFLGHSSVITTEIYAKTNPEIKRKYLESAASNIDISVNKFSEKEKETLLEWLKHNI